ncbi:MAG: hypothetical protein QOF76_2303 [Solirubrobacteraceae bacterium]|jgi:hypothetical protein|nr:hypothetical protein [Solirubrobacteraceae bacterium]
MRVILIAILALGLLPAVAPAKPLISYDRSGGFRGTPLSLECGVKGHCSALEGFEGAGNAFTLSKKALKRLKASIKQAGFDTLTGPYQPTPGTVADGYTESVTYKGKTVVAGTGGDVPERLSQLLGRLATIAQSHVSTQ